MIIITDQSMTQAIALQVKKFKLLTAAKLIHIIIRNSGHVEYSHRRPRFYSNLIYRYSPLFHLRVGIQTPFFIQHGDMDKLVPITQSEKFKQKADHLGVNCSLISVKNAGRGWSREMVNEDIHPNIENIMDQAYRFMKVYYTSP